MENDARISVDLQFNATCQRLTGHLLNSDTCLVLSREKKTYEDAKFACTQMQNGHLAHIRQMNVVHRLASIGFLDPNVRNNEGAFVGGEQVNLFF